MGRARHLGLGLQQHAEEIDEIVHRGRLGDRLQLLRLGGRQLGGRRGGRHLHHEQAAEHLHDVTAEAGEVLALARGAVYGLERGGAVAGEECGRQGAHLHRRGGAEQPGHARFLEPPLAVGDGRVQQRERVAEAPLRRAHQQRQGRRVELDLLLGEDLGEPAREEIGGDGAEVEALAAREHGGRDLLGIGRGEDEDHVVGRLLERLQEGVEGRPREHVDLVHDVDLVAPARGRVLHVLAKRPDLLHAVVRRGVDLEHVHGRARGEVEAGGTFPAGLGLGAAPGAGQRLGEEPRGGGLAHAARPREEIGVRHAPGGEGVAQRAGDGLLPDDRVEGLRPPLPREDLVRHRSEEKTVHPQSNRPYRELRLKPAPVRYSHGTREGRLTVAPFRAWRGSALPVAWGPTLNAVPNGSFDTSGPQGGIQPRCSGLRVTGHRYLPV